MISEGPSDKKQGRLTCRCALSYPGFRGEGRRARVQSSGQGQLRATGREREKKNGEDGKGGDREDVKSSRDKRYMYIFVPAYVPACVYKRKTDKCRERDNKTMMSALCILIFVHARVCRVLADKVATTTD